MPGDKIVLGKNPYGKAGDHVVRITSDTVRHEIEDLTVISQLRGDFESCHTEGDNSHCVATDTQKNTIFSLAMAWVPRRLSCCAWANTLSPAPTGAAAADGPRDFPKINEVFPELPPARSSIAVAEIPGEAKVTIEAIAALRNA